MLLATPEPTPTPSPGPVPSGHTVLTWGQTLTALLVIAGVVLLIGLVLWAASASGAPPHPGGPAPAGGGVARSWIALSLIAGLLFCAVLAFAVDDSTIRSGLIGALGAAVGAATAFFFSSRSTDQAQSLLNTSMGTETVPDLLGRTADDAMRVLSTTTLKLVTDPASPVAPPPPVPRTVVKQLPPPGTTSPKGTTVLVTYG
ncbi:PASTA domain-containing protein [Kitasatospora sp. NPDC101183]|uniref:PASTA domain-containing protein n=1 Tax=Kitasatospora sp. NPDC101183 TaxID=3364100 RepID=UPI0038082047